VVIAQDDSPDAARDIVAKAVKAMGREGKAIPKGIRMKTKATLVVPVFKDDIETATVNMVETITMGLPGKFRIHNVATALGETVPITAVFDGKQGWLETDGKIREMEEHGLQDFKEMANIVEATQLIAPLLDKKYTLKALGHTMIDGKSSVGIRVSRKGFADLKLYFDDLTFVLVKMERKALDPQVAQPCREVRYYRTYQKMNGLMVPGTIVLLRDGRQINEFQVLEYSYLNEVAASEFARPKQ
jgi:hypothetical protein